MTMAPAQNGAQAPVDIATFRQASIYKQATLSSIVGTYGTTGGVAQGYQLPSMGYISAIEMPMTGTLTTGTGSDPSEDLPWMLAKRIRLTDSSGGIIYNLSGYNSFVHSKFMMGHRAWVDQSSDTTVFVTADGTGTDAYVVHFEVPVATNERDQIGLLPNQSDAYKYTLGVDTPAIGEIFGTAGTATSTGTLVPHYDYYTIPSGGAQNVPPYFGVVHQVYDTVWSPGTAPGANNRYNIPLGNVIRGWALTVRDAGVRENGIAAIRLKFGDDVLLWQATGTELRQEQFMRNGRDCPAGVYILDRMSDSGLWVGDDYRSQYLDTRQLAQAWFEVDFTGIAGAATVDIVTDQLIVPGSVRLN